MRNNTIASAEAQLNKVVENFIKSDKLNRLVFSNAAGAIELEKELQPRGHVSAIGFCIGDDDDEDDYDEDDEEEE